MINTNMAITNNVSFRSNYVAEILKNDKVKKATIAAATSVAGILLADNLKKTNALENETRSSQTPLLVDSVQGDASIHEVFGKVKSPLTFFKKDMAKIVKMPDIDYYYAIRSLTKNLPERRKKLDEKIQKNGYETTSSTREVSTRDYDYVEKTVTYIDRKSGEVVKEEVYRNNTLQSQEYYVYDSDGNLVEKIGMNSVTKFDYKNGRLVQSTHAYGSDYLRITSFGKDGAIMMLEKAPYDKPVLKTNVIKIQKEENDDIDPLELDVRNILGYPTKKGIGISVKTIFTNKACKKEYEQIKKLISTYVTDDDNDSEKLFDILEMYCPKEDQRFLDGIELIYSSSPSYMSKKIDRLVEEEKYEEVISEVERFANLDGFDRGILIDDRCRYGNHIRRVSSDGTVHITTGHYEYRVTSMDHDLGNTKDWYVDSHFTYNLDNVAKEGWTREKILEAVQPMTADEMYEFEKNLAKISKKYD